MGTTVALVYEPAERLRAQLDALVEDAGAQATALRGLDVPEVSMGVAPLVLEQSVPAAAGGLSADVDGVIRAMRLIDPDGGPDATGLVPFDVLSEAGDGATGQDYAQQAEQAVADGDDDRLAEIVAAANAAGEDAAWFFWQEFDPEQVDEAIDLLIEDVGNERRLAFIRLMASGDRAGAFTQEEQRVLITEVREAGNGGTFAYDLLVDGVGDQSLVFGDDFTYQLVEHVWVNAAYVDQQIRVLGAAEGRPELAARLLGADPATWGHWAWGDLDEGDRPLTDTVAQTIFTNEVFDEPGAALVSTVLEGDPATPGRDAAVLAVVRVAGSEEADFRDVYRPLLADIYDEYRVDFTEGIGLHPYEGAQVQLDGRDGLELGGTEIRAFLAEVALDDASWARVETVTGEELGRLGLMVGQGEGLGETGNDAAIFRTSGRLQAVVLLSRNDALLHQGESVDARREALAGTLSNLVKVGKGITDPVGTATSLVFEHGPNVIAGVIVPDGDVPAPTDPASALPGASATGVAADYNALVADLEAGGGGENTPEVDQQIVDEAQAYNEGLPADERFLGPDGLVLADLTPEQEAHLVRWASGVPGSGQTTYFATYDDKHFVGDWLYQYAQVEPATADNV